ncbi:hypothetical protein LAD67_08475 [Escherichia coli]|nr:hypothetical protein [Escherichia coli]
MSATWPAGTVDIIGKRQPTAPEQPSTITHVCDLPVTVDSGAVAIPLSTLGPDDVI